MILYNRLLKFCIENKILSPNKLGFVPGNRTSDAHLIIHNLVRKQCHDNRGRIHSCFIDFSKAFDTIPRDKLLKKLLNLGIDGNFFNIIKNIYTNDKICIKHEDKITDPIDVNLGVKQGCILSPLLFNIFLSDLPQILDNDIKNNNQSNHPSSIFWADDIVLFSESEEGLRKMLKSMEIYCKENELTLNTEKTKCMIFNKGGKLLRTPFHYNNEKLENVRKFKYLGFLITPSGEIISGLNDLRDRALKGFYKLKSAMGDYFRDNIRITIFDSLIKPILMYMNDFWGGLPAIKEKCNPIEKLHFMVCKQILGVQKQTTNVGVLLELGRIPLQNFAVKAAIKNWERIKKGNINGILMNSHIDAIFNNLPWITNIKAILQSHSIDAIRLNRSRAKHPFIHKIVYQKQCEDFHNQAFESIRNQENKLRTYGLSKQTLDAKSICTKSPI